MCGHFKGLLRRREVLPKKITGLFNGLEVQHTTINRLCGAVILLAVAHLPYRDTFRAIIY